MPRCNQYMIEIVEIEKMWSMFIGLKVVWSEICSKPKGNNTISKQLRFNYYYLIEWRYFIKRPTIYEIYWVKRKSIVPKQTTNIGSLFLNLSTWKSLFNFRHKNNRLIEPVEKKVTTEKVSELIQWGSTVCTQKCAFQWNEQFDMNQAQTH